MNHLRVCMCLLVCVALISGCARKGAEEGDVEIVPVITTQVVMENLDVLHQSEGLRAALDQGILELQVPAASGREVDLYTVLNWMVDRVRESGDPEMLLSFSRDVLSASVDAGITAIRMLSSDAVDKLGADAWVAFLLEEEMPIVVQAYGVHAWLSILGADASAEEVANKLAFVLQDDFVAYQDELFRFTLGQALDHADSQRFWRILAGVEPLLPVDSQLWPSVHILKGRGLLRDGKLADAFAHYRSQAEVLGDARLAGEYYRLMQAVDEASQVELLDEIRAYGYSVKSFPVLRQRVARWDLQKLKDETDVLAMVKGVREILGHEIPLNVVAPSFLGQLYYSVLSTADAEGLQALSALVKEMDVAAENDMESLRASIATALLDAYFYLEDYRSALARLQSGVAGFDEAWHEELIDKVQAHLAESEGRGADAVSFYQKHIERVRNWTEPLRSPETGRLIAPIEVIALNERRIGDIWKKEGEMEKSAAAYARAEESYRAALDAYAEEPESLAEMQKALDELIAVEK